MGPPYDCSLPTASLPISLFFLWSAFGPAAWRNFFCFLEFSNFRRGIRAIE